MGIDESSKDLISSCKANHRCQRIRASSSGITPFLVKAIEDRGERRNFTFREKLKAGDPVAIEGDYFAIEEQGARRKPGDRGCDVRVGLGAILAVSG